MIHNTNWRRSQERKEDRERGEIDRDEHSVDAFRGSPARAMRTATGVADARPFLEEADADLGILRMMIRRATDHATWEEIDVSPEYRES